MPPRLSSSLIALLALAVAGCGATAESADDGAGGSASTGAGSGASDTSHHAVGGDAESTADEGDSGGPTTAPVVIVDPDYLLFSYVTPMTEALHESFRVSNAGTAELVITGLRIDGTSVNYAFSSPPPLPTTLAPGESVDVTIRFAAFDPAISSVIVSTNDPAHGEVAVKVAGQKKLGPDDQSPPPIPMSNCVLVAPGELDFGPVPRGEVRDDVLSIHNCDPGDRDVLVHYAYVAYQHSTSIATPAFEINPPFPLPAVIPAGESLPLGIRFTPREVGELETNLVIGGTWPSKAVLLRGTAIEPADHTQAVKIRLTWDRAATDVDSHLIAPGGAIWHQHHDCWFANRGPDWGAVDDMTDDPFLDLDDVDGLGPEHINMQEPSGGPFRFLAHYYSAGASGTEVSEVTVEVFEYGELVATFGPQPLEVKGEVWEVFDLSYDDGVLSLDELGEHYISEAPW